MKLRSDGHLLVVAAVLVLSTLSGNAVAQAVDLGGSSCVVESLDPPFGNPTFAVHELGGAFFSGGWFHMQRRQADWNSLGVVGPGGGTFVGEMMDWNGGIALGGLFFTLGGDDVPAVGARNVGFFDGSQFSALGSGLNADVEAFAIWNGQLVAGGIFDASGSGAVMSLVARWDGAAWQPLGAGLEGAPSGFTPRVWDLEVYQGDLYASGLFDMGGGQSVNGLARWAGNSWQPLGAGLSFEGGLGVGTEMAVHDGKLYVSGVFDQIGGKSISFLASWDGTSFEPVGTAPSSHNFSMLSFGGHLFASGTVAFEIDGFTYDMGYWDGTEWVGVGDADGQMRDLKVSSQDPNQLIVGGNQTTFNGQLVQQVFTLTCPGLMTIFSDGFESGDTTLWSTVIPSLP